jgi:ribose-phosphate pyrophosphokinase
MLYLEIYKVNPTIFPDKTSQVWKFPRFVENSVFKIKWEFQAESEFMHLAQLVDLVRTYKPQLIELDMPYLPYARQDKEISNDTTFALRTFAKLLNSLELDSVMSVDVHSDVAKELINNFKDCPSLELKLNFYVGHSSPTLLCFPDAGALNRYKDIIKTSIPSCSFSKIRDQDTGYIRSLILDQQNILIKNERVLIVDDLCDGGMTFKLVAEKLRELGASEVNLYVSHGIFSKGVQTLRDSGIKRIFTIKGEVDEVDSNVVM